MTRSHTPHARPMWRTLTPFLCVVAFATLAACDDDGGGEEPGPDTTMSADATTVGDASDATTTTDDATTEPTDAATTDPGDAATDAGEDTADTVDTTMVTCDPPNGVRPPRLSEHTGGYLYGSDLFVVFSGSLGIPENCGFPQRTYEDTTWVYDTQCDQWTELQSAGPDGRARSAAAYDSVGDRLIVFGGLTASSNLADTWAFDGESQTWTQLQTTGTAPAARFNHAAGYDPVGNRFFVFGGNTGTILGPQIQNDVYQLDLATLEWSNVTPTGGDAPEARTWPSATWDPANNLFVIYGGGSDTAFTSPDPDYYGDVWGWSDAGASPVWRRLDIGGGATPPGRFWPGLAFDSTSRSLIMFGGHDDANDPTQNLLGNRNDTWFFDAFAGTWNEHLAGDQYNSPATGFCQFPPDYTIIEEASPERRNAFAMGAGPDGVYIMGGKTDCGVIDDLIYFDFTTRAWSLPTRATQGEVCLRRGGGDTCTDMCL